MSDASSSITRSAVTDEALHMRSLANDVKAELDRLDSEVAKLREKWVGKAQEAYNDAHRKWTQKTEDMNQLLDQIGAKAIDLAEKYGQQDAKSAGRFH